MKIILYSSSVYFCHLFLISSASVRSIPFLPFIVPIFIWNIPSVSLIFLKKISSLSHFIVFLYFSALITEEGFLISPRYSLVLCIQMDLSFLFSFAFSSHLTSAICKPPSGNHSAFLHFFFLGDGIDFAPVKYRKPLSILIQALCLLDLIPWNYLSLPLHNLKEFDWGHTWMA